MAHAILIFIEVLAVLGTFCGLAYYGVCIASAISFLRERKAREVAGS